MTDHFTALFLFCTFCPVRRVSSSVMGINSITCTSSGRQQKKYRPATSPDGEGSREEDT